MAASDLLEHHDQLANLREIAKDLVLAERIAYRFQYLNRRELYDGAIFVDDVDHDESIFSPTGNVSTREDWKDNEVSVVISWLAERYPTLEDHFEPPTEE